MKFLLSLAHLPKTSWDLPFEVSKRKITLILFFGIDASGITHFVPDFKLLFGSSALDLDNKIAICLTWLLDGSYQTALKFGTYIKTFNAAYQNGAA